MNVLFISALDFKSKSIQVIARTPQAYGARGHRVWYITCRDAEEDGDYFYEPVINPQGVKVVRIRLPSLIPKKALPGKLQVLYQKLRYLFFFLPPAVWHATRIAKAHSIDVVYGNEVWGVIAAHLSNLYLKKPIVSRFYGSVLYPLIERNDYVGCLLKVEHLIALWLPGNLTIMTNDGTKGRKVLKALGSPVKSLLYLRNGVDKDSWRGANELQFPEMDRGENPRRFVILAISRLVYWKRVDRIIDAFGCLQNSFRDRMRLVVVGDGPERSNLLRKSRVLGIEEAITFVGAVPHEQVPAYMSLADIFVSLYDLSNVGNPLLEALTAGKAVITLDNGDTREIIQHNANGILIAAEPEERIPVLVAEALQRLVLDPGYMLQLRQGAKAYADENFWSWEERFDVEVRAVEQLCADRLKSH